MDDRQPTRASLNGHAYARLCSELKAGCFRPGEKLKLRDLAAQMGMSPTPVREALARLISERALEQVGHHSVRVPVMNEAQFDEVCYLRMTLEGEAAARAALRATARDVAHLQAVHERMAAHREAGNVAAALIEMERFHMDMYRLAGMPLLLGVVESLWLRSGPLMNALESHPIGGPRKQHPHLMLLRGLRRGDPEQARQGIREEIERMTKPILAYLREQAGAVPVAAARPVSRVAADRAAA